MTAPASRWQTERERTAFHESGHVIGALAFGIPVISVTIDLADPHLYRDRYRPNFGVDLGIEALTTLCLAGPAAETLFCGPPPAAVVAGDLAQARRYLSRRYTALELPLQLARAQDAAKWLVNDQRHRIELLAAALLERTRLSAEDIAEVLSR